MERSYNAIEKKFAKNIDLLYRVRQFPNKESLKTIYFSYNHSYLNYANIAWASTYFMKLKTIHDEQKHAARIICNDLFCYHSMPINMLTLCTNLKKIRRQKHLLWLLKSLPSILLSF